ncbi:MAG: LysM peptidoglycan-binding domain-containing protein [Fimbriimonadaceae bacterium]|nr:LysM peptidoglycan-binding domain-containing protein [Chitinophagales bacterium]
MNLQEKYKDALDKGAELEMAEGYVKEENGVLKIGGKAKYQMQKDLVWDKIKKAGGDAPTDVIAEIEVEDTTIYGVHKVQPGDSLSKIAKSAYDDAGKYMQIFEANKDQLSDPDKIQIGQELVIPNLS